MSDILVMTLISMITMITIDMTRTRDMFTKKYNCGSIYVLEKMVAVKMKELTSNLGK